MKLVVDTNVLFSFFKKDSTTRKIITRIDLFKFFTLKSRIEELVKHKEEICLKAKMSLEEFYKILKELEVFVEVVDDRKVVLFAKKAKKLAPHEEDIPCFALALAIKASIWSEEVAFKKQSKIKVFSTSDIIRFLNRLGIEIF